jgi:hypothetical protein
MAVPSSLGSEWRLYLHTLIRETFHAGRHQVAQLVMLLHSGAIPGGLAELLAIIPVRFLQNVWCTLLQLIAAEKYAAFIQTSSVRQQGKVEREIQQYKRQRTG